MRILKALVVTVFMLFLACNPAIAADTVPTGTVTIAAITDDEILFDISEVPWFEGETPRMALENAAKLDPSINFETNYIAPYGECITKIGDVAPGEEEAWVLFLNEKPSFDGIDTAILNNGDVLLWAIAPQEPEVGIDNSDSNSEESVL